MVIDPPFTTISPNDFVPGYFFRCAGYDSADLMAPVAWTQPGRTFFGPTEREPRLYVIIGPQRGGKSTLARKWLRREASLVGEMEDGVPRYMWDSDLLRLELYGERHKRCGEPMVYAIKNYAIRTALATESDVCVAGTHLSRTSLRRLLEIRRDLIPVLVDTPEDVCIERAIATGQEDLVPVIERSCRRLETIKNVGLHNYIQSILEDMDSKVSY